MIGADMTKVSFCFHIALNLLTPPPFRVLDSSFEAREGGPRCSVSTNRNSSRAAVRYAQYIRETACDVHTCHA